MRVGILQFAPTFKEKEKNLAQIEKFITNVSADGLVLPELATTGYAFESTTELAQFAEPIPGPTTDRLCKLAISKGMWLVFGMAEKESESIYNSCVFISKEQALYKYRKLHLFKYEKLIFTPGNLSLQVISVGDVKIGLIICFDWLFPEAMRTLALQGAQIICHPSNLVLRYCQPAMQTRAVENGVFIITANRTGKERGIKFTGKSQIVNPKGEVILKFTAREQCVKVVEIEPKASLDKNITEYNHLFKDRRTEFYHL